MKIAVGLSGGVDSAVAAYILKKQGYDIVALFMRNWHDTAGKLHGECEWEDDLNIAKMVAKKLDIPFHFVDLSSEYRKRVVDYMFAEYEKGRTPNPDVLCNREIKFDAFLKAAEDIGAHKVATGHYCRSRSFINEAGETVYSLLAGVDPNKDQSYFLCQLSQQQLSKAVFPIGELLKPEVRQIASENGLPNADRKDSQGICFVGKVDLPVFLQQQLQTKQGDVIEILPNYYDNTAEPADSLQALATPYTYTPANGKKLGTHQGAHFYTVGQRKGLGIGGKASPLFIIGTDTVNNLIFVGEGNNHPGLYRKALFIDKSEIHHIRPDKALNTGDTEKMQVRIRYRQALQAAALHMQPEGLYIVFDEPQRGITPGQFAAWYDGDELLGSGVIAK